MAYSYNSYTGDGATQLFTAPDYLEQDDITVTVDGVSTAFTWNTSSVVDTGSPPASGALVVVRRTTNKDTREVDFTTTSMVREEELDKDSNQLFYVMQESLDTVENNLDLDADTNSWDFDNKQSENVPAPTSGDSVASKSYVDAKVSAETAAPIKLYVDSTEVDQGAAGAGLSVKDLIDGLSASEKAILVFQHNGGSATTYTFTTGQVIPENVFIEVLAGAVLDGTVNLESPGHIIAAPSQQVFTDTSTITFNDGGAITFQWFGATGDGSTDDAAAVQAAIASLIGGGSIDGLDATYVCDSSISLVQNLRIRNATFDISGAGAGVFMSLSGSEDSADALTSNAAIGDTDVSIADASGYAKNDYIWLKSTDVYDSTSTIKMGEIHKVVSTTATDITLCDGILYGYTTADSSVVSKLNFQSCVYIECCGFIGDGTDNQIAVSFSLCRDIHIVGCSTTTGRGFSFGTCIDFDVSNCVFTDANSPSGGYGILVESGSHWFSIHHNTFNKCEQGVLVGGGGSDGFMRWCSIHHNTVYGTDGAAIRIIGAEQWDVHHNQISTISGTSSGYGIYARCLNGTISENTVVGPAGGGIYVANLVDEFDAGATHFWMEITGNKVRAPASGNGIYFNDSQGITVGNLVVNGNSVYDISGSACGINLQIGGTSTMFSLVVSGNSITGYGGTNACLLVDSADTSSLSNVSITGNSFLRTNDTYNNIEISGNATNDIIGISITGNTLVSGTWGVRGVNEENICIVGNVIRAMVSGATTLTAASNTVASNV